MPHVVSILGTTVAVNVDAFLPNYLVWDVDFQPVKSCIVEWQNGPTNTKTVHLISGTFMVDPLTLSSQLHICT